MSTAKIDLDAARVGARARAHSRLLDEVFRLVECPKACSAIMEAAHEYGDACYVQGAGR